MFEYELLSEHMLFEKLATLLLFFLSIVGYEEYNGKRSADTVTIR